MLLRCWRGSPGITYKLYTLSSKASEVEIDFNAFAQDAFVFVSFVPIPGAPRDLLAELGDASAEGWELVAIFPQGGGVANVNALMLFKRSKTA